MAAAQPFTFHIVTLFPDAFASYFDASIIGRALKEKKIRVKFYNPRDFVTPPKGKKKKDWFYRQVDDKPYGGGPGMVLRAEPFLKAVTAALRESRITNHESWPNPKGKKSKVVSPAMYFFDASGEQFTNEMARKLVRQFTGHLTSRKSKTTRRPTSCSLDVILICGRYEGIDARVWKAFKAHRISIGPYTLTGGELPAMLVVDAVARQIPGVLGKFESVEEERVASSEVYTRPEVLKWGGKNYRVPKVLLGGNHKDIEAWRKRAS